MEATYMVHEVGISLVDFGFWFRLFPTLTRGVFVFSVVSPPPSPPPASRFQPTATNLLPPTNCHRPIVNNQLPLTNCHQPIATHQLPPTICHQPTVINQLSSTNLIAPHHLSSTNCHQLTNQVSSTALSPTNCHQPISTNQVSPTNHQPIVTNALSPTNCDLHANCLLQGVGCMPWRWLALAGAAGSPLLFRCDLRAGFCGRGRSAIWTVAKCKNREFFKGVGFSLVMGSCQHKWRKMYPKMSQQRPQR